MSTRGSWTSTTWNNEFLAVNQFTIIVGGKNRRPDILLFVNGLPLGQIELKAPGAKAWRRRSSIRSPLQRDDPSALPLRRDHRRVGLHQARVGTITTPAEHFAEWKTMSADDAERARPQLELMIEGVFARLGSLT